MTRRTGTMVSRASPAQGLTSRPGRLRSRRLELVNRRVEHRLAEHLFLEPLASWPRRSSHRRVDTTMINGVGSAYSGSDRRRRHLGVHGGGSIRLMPGLRQARVITRRRSRRSPRSLRPLRGGGADNPFSNPDRRDWLMSTEPPLTSRCRDTTCEHVELTRPVVVDHRNRRLRPDLLAMLSSPVGFHRTVG